MSHISTRTTELLPEEKRALLAQLLEKKANQPNATLERETTDEPVDELQAESSNGKQPLPTRVKGMEFSLFYFSSNEADFTDNKYQLVLEGAKFADRHGFTA